jgi:hypothetical protein
MSTSNTEPVQPGPVPVPVPGAPGATEVAESKEDYSLDDSVFDLKTPKDIRDGFGGGMGNILKGALGGTALLLSAPVKCE